MRLLRADELRSQKKSHEWNFFVRVFFLLPSKDTLSFWRSVNRTQNFPRNEAFIVESVKGC